MSEGKLDPTVIQIFEVKPAHLYINDGETTSRDEMTAVRKAIRENKIEPKGSYALGIKMARQEILKVEEEFGLEIKDPRGMQVSILPEAAFRTIYKDMTKQDAGGSIGGYAQDLGGVILMKQDGPSYVQAGVIYHEFVHKFLERHVQAFANVKDLKTKRFGHAYDYRRSGLSVTNIKRSEKPPVVGDRGELLNELGNFLEEQRFMTLLLERPEFSDEKNIRDSLLKKMRLRPQDAWDVKARIKDGKSVLLRFSQENIHPDNNGNFSPTSMHYYMQLATDLGKICDPENSGKLFRKLLLQAKIDPGKQNELRDLLDNKLGAGFYTKLKDAEYEQDYNFLDLLSKVQSALYPNLKYSDLIIPEPPISK